MPKLRTLSDLKKDPRVERVILNYDRKGNHLLELKEGYWYPGDGRTIDIGSIKWLCYGLNEGEVEERK